MWFTPDLLFLVLLPAIARVLGGILEEHLYRPAIAILWTLFIVVLLWGIHKRAGSTE
jgi:hypothetical protein